MSLGPDRLSPQAGRARGRMVPWVVLGVVASVGLVLTGASVGSTPGVGGGYSWLDLPRSMSHVIPELFYVALCLMVAAWLGLGGEARAGNLTTKRAGAVLAAWGTPLFLGPPLFSRDLYSYIGQGLVANHGLDPYTVGPAALGKGPLVASIASVWRDTPAPYGPLFVTMTRGVTAVFGNALVADVLALRVLELVGVGLLLYSLPRLARILGVDPGIALWLGVLSPLALYSFISSGHNDALMLGLLVSGVTLALERRPVAGVVCCALATMVKLPAAAAIVFLAAHQLGSVRGIRRWALVARTTCVAAVTVTVVTVASGLGWRWLGPNALRIPAELRTLSAPAVSIGVLLFHVLRLVGLPVRQHACVTVTQWSTGVAGLAVVAWLIAHVSRLDMVRTLGIALIVIVVVGPTLWPWYFTWGLVVLAATPVQRSKTLAVGAGFAMFVVGPSGSPVLGGSDYILVVVACCAAGQWLIRNRRWMDVMVPRGLEPQIS